MGLTFSWQGLRKSRGVTDGSLDVRLARRLVADARPEPWKDGISNIFFGDPCHRGRLRDLLEARAKLVPPGGEIVWITYYFRDEQLADALIRAHRRSVRVLVSVEGRPRVRRANDAVIAKLSDPEKGIGDGLRVVRRGLFRHLDEKLYCSAIRSRWRSRGRSTPRATVPRIHASPPGSAIRTGASARRLPPPCRGSDAGPAGGEGRAGSSRGRSGADPGHRLCQIGIPPADAGAGAGAAEQLFRRQAAFARAALGETAGAPERAAGAILELLGHP